MTNPADKPEDLPNSGRHRAPDGDAQTAYIPRITDVSDDGVPGGPLDPPIGLGGVVRAAVPPVVSGAKPAPRRAGDVPPAVPSAADTAVLRTDLPARAGNTASNGFDAVENREGVAAANMRQQGDRKGAESGNGRYGDAQAAQRPAEEEFDFFAKTADGGSGGSASGAARVSGPSSDVGM